MPAVTPAYRVGITGLPRGVASRGRFQPAPSAHSRFFTPRRASAGDFSGQVSCLPGFWYGWGCFGRGHAPTGGGGLACQIGMPCPQWCFALRGAWQAGFWRQQAGFSTCAWGWLSSWYGWRISSSGALPANHKTGADFNPGFSPTGRGVSRAQHRVQLTSLRSRVRGRDLQTLVVVSTVAVCKRRSATNTNVGRHRLFS